LPPFFNTFIYPTQTESSIAEYSTHSTLLASPTLLKSAQSNSLAYDLPNTPFRIKVRETARGVMGELRALLKNVSVRSGGGVNANSNESASRE
jgi:hypothetical protein